MGRGIAIAVWLGIAGIVGGVTTEVEESVKVVVDGYTYKTYLQSPATLKIGTAFVLECRVAGLPYHTLIHYNWTYPQSHESIRWYHNIKVMEYGRLRVTVVDEGDEGEYVCMVTVRESGKMIKSQFQLKVEGGVVMISDNGPIPNNAAITNRSAVLAHNRLRYSANFDIGAILCIAPKGSKPLFSRSSNKREITDFGSAWTSDMTQRRSNRTAMLIIRDLSATRNTKVCCTARSDTKACVYLLLEQSQHDREITVNIPNKKVKIDDPEQYSSYLATFEHTLLGLKETTLVSSAVSTKELFPGAAYRLSVRGISKNGESYSTVPAVVDGIRNKLNLNQDFPLGPPRLLSITRVLLDGIELNWLTPVSYTPQNYTVWYSTDTVNHSAVAHHQDGSIYFNLTGLDIAKYNIKVTVSIDGTEYATTAVLTYYHNPSRAYDPDYPSSDTLSVTLPLIVILVVALITTLVVSIIVHKVKSSTNTPNRPVAENHKIVAENHRTEAENHKTVAENHRQVIGNVPVEDDPYESVDWDKPPESEEKK